MLARGKRFLHHDLWTADLDSLGALERVGIQALRLMIAVVSEFRHRLLDTRAASLVYVSLLSLVPFLAVIFSVLKAFGVHQQIELVLARALEPLGEKGQEITAQIIGFVSNLQVGVLGAVGVATLFVTTYLLIHNIEEALNSIWCVRQGRPWARKVTDYLIVVLVGPLLVFTAFALIASAQSHWLVQRILAIEPLGYLVVWGTQFMPFVLLWGVFSFFYKFVPNTKVRLSSALVGGITAAILWQLAGWAFAAFVAGSARYSAIYSSFAILVLFLVWLYLSWVIVLVGAQVAFFHQHPSAYQTQVLWRQGSHEFRERVALALLLHITRRYLAGTPPHRFMDVASVLHVPVSIIEEIAGEFIAPGILCRMSEPEGVSLARPPELVPMSEVLDLVRRRKPVVSRPKRELMDPVENLLRGRDQAAEQALAGVTLRSFAIDGEAQAAGLLERAPRVKEPVG